MEYMTPNFTKDMVKTHKILIPNMAVTQFRLLQAALECEGYNVEVLGNCGSEVAQLGLKYVHNDTCYPALLVIGQFIDALNSGKYDLDHTALLITQTGGGCRASNYIKLLRKALVKAGYGNIPVASLNFSGLEKGSGLPLTLPLIRKVIACIYYGDLLVALRSQTKPYENKPGSADALTEKWIATIQSWMHKSINYNVHDMKRQFAVICASYASVPVTRVPKVKVGVVGEIYVKYSPLGNNDLEKFLESQDCEVNLPGLMGFVEYCVANMTLDVELYGGSKVKAMATDKLLDWIGTAYTVFVNAVPSLVSYSLVLVFGSKYLGFPTLYSTRNVGPSSVLPIVCLSLASIAGYALWTRRYMVDELTRDYIKLARVKGLSSSEIMFKHVLRNAMVPMVQYIPQSILLTVGGSLLMERFFSVPGMGPLLTDAIQRYDLNVVQTLVIFYAVLGIAGVFLGDVLMMVIDPRITLTGKEAAR